MSIVFITLLCIVVIYLIIKKPDLFRTSNSFSKPKENYYTIDDKYNAERADKQKEIDRILDKISSKGLESLSKKEKQLLEEFSKK